MTKSAKAETELANNPHTTKVNVTLHGRDYIVACDAGEEKKLASLVKLVDDKLNSLAGQASNISETRLFMLTCLLLADELIETRKHVTENRKADEDLMIAAVDHLRERILSISAQIGKA